MTRKEMIETIAKKAGCSKRLVRKRLFQLSARNKRYYTETLFNRAFLNKSTDWVDWEELHEKWKQDKTVIPWQQTNTFEVAAFPIGVIVLFRVDEMYDREIMKGFGQCGCRLYNFKGFVE